MKLRPIGSRLVVVASVIVAAACASSTPPPATAAPEAAPPPAATTSTDASTTSTDASAPARTPAEGLVCTMEAKTCPDGTEVGRSGPRCEFAACPATKTCTTNADCPDGVCVGPAGCNETFHCAKIACTRDLASFCGCDGKTFQASGSCPTKRYAKRGPC